METASTFARILVEQLLNVHALTNMYRADENKEHMKTACGWLPILESNFAALKREIEKHAS